MSEWLALMVKPEWCFCQVPAGGERLVGHLRGQARGRGEVRVRRGDREVEVEVEGEGDGEGGAARAR
jgi:hypothetical protein